MQWRQGQAEKLSSRRIKQQNCGSNKFLHREGREDETDAEASVARGREEARPGDLSGQRIT